MIGTIMIQGLEIECVVGIYPDERKKKQVLLVDVEFDYDFEAAAKNDDVKHTVDYVDIASELTKLAVSRRYRLIETFAEEGAALLLDKFKGDRAEIKIMKPEAVPAASWAAVRVERRR